MSLTPSQLLQRFEQAESDRLTTDSHWEEVARLALSNRAFTTRWSAGAKRDQEIFDATAPNALDDFSGAMHGLNSNPAIRWMDMISDDFDMESLDTETRQWLYDTTSRILLYFASPRSGFSTSSHETYLDLGAFGTGVSTAIVTKGWLRFDAQLLSSCYLVENEQSEIVEVYRKMCLTPRQAIATFGPDVWDRNVRERASESGQGQEDKIDVIHAVYKVDDADPMDVSFRGMPWQSRYIWRDEKKFVRQGGFRESPYLTPRWTKASGETYGRGPAMRVLPAIKVANALARMNLIAGEQIIRPPIGVPVGSMAGPITTQPGSIWYLRTGGKNRPEPINLGTRPDIGMELLRDARQQIKAAFMLDKLELPTADDQHGQPRMTAAEVNQRRMQSLIFASPATTRIQVEYLTVAVTKVFNWMFRTGRLLPPPDRLVGRGLRPLYTSPLAQSQRASEVNNVISALTTAQLFIQADPRLMQNVLDPEEALRTIWSLSNAPPKMLRSRAESQQRAEQDQQAEELQAAGQIAESFASAGADASKVLQSGQVRPPGV